MTQDANRAIETFWRWWSYGGPRLAEQLASGDVKMTAEISARVKKIHEDLDWETGPGQDGKTHTFALSPKGDPALRFVAQQWLEAAVEDETWSFRATRQRYPSDPEQLQLGWAELPIPFADFRFVVQHDEARERLHLDVWHPVFRVLPEDQHPTVMFVALDAIVGEDGVETWVGHLRTLPEAPSDDLQPVGPGILRAAVDRLQAQATGDRWGMLQGTHEDGRPVMVLANLALKRWQYPSHWDHHVEIQFSLQHTQDSGLPTREELDALAPLEQALRAGVESIAVHAGTETHGGVRVMHLYGPDEAGLRKALLRWTSAMVGRGAEITWDLDPTWAVLRRWA